MQPLLPEWIQPAAEEVPKTKPLSHTDRGVKESIQTILQEHFGLIQIGISLFFIAVWAWNRSKENAESRFKLREADRELHFKRSAPGEAQEATPRKKEKLRLSGIAADGAAHEVLGISALASEAEIQKAFREKMKQYHPDQIGRSDSPEWKDATRIAEAINRARQEMLEKLKRRR